MYITIRSRYIDPSGNMIEDGNGGCYSPSKPSSISSTKSSAKNSITNAITNVTKSNASNASAKCDTRKNKVNNKITQIKEAEQDFIAGAAVAIDNNLFFSGAQNITGHTEFSDTTAFKLGKITGDIGTTVLGAAGTIAGGMEIIGGVAGGVLAAPATGGQSIIVGGAVALEGVGLTAARLTVTGVSANNLAKDVAALASGNGSTGGSNGGNIKNLYNSIKEAPKYPDGFKAVKMEQRKPI
ncbi:hypothetical protein [Alkaliphilus crotonatoxidans]